MFPVLWVLPIVSPGNGLSPRLQQLNCDIERDHKVIVSTYNDPEDFTEDAVFLYYFSTLEQLSQGAFLQHMGQRKNPSENSLAVLDFDIASVCPSFLVYFSGVVLLDGGAESHLTALKKEISKILYPSRSVVSKHALNTFFAVSFVGDSAPYRALVGEVMKLSPCVAPVLIEGETGTGKELLARALHYLGERSERGFIPVNCAAIPETLLESELFGHEKGAFTHAQQRNPGLIELAEGGTLFLDEVDALSIRAQQALLRFLQTGEVRAVGSAKFRKANVRVIAATNADLNALIETGMFREDLYFRLNVLSLQVPPLRERTEDIEVIAHALLKKFEQQHRRGKKLLHPNLLAWLKEQAWPGNVRELENFLLRRYLLTDGVVLSSADVRQSSGAITNIAALNLNLSYGEAKDALVDKFSEHYISSMLTKTGGNVSHAAKLAGKERRAFGKLMKKYHIDAQGCGD